MFGDRVIICEILFCILCYAYYVRSSNPKNPESTMLVKLYDVNFCLIASPVSAKTNNPQISLHQLVINVFPNHFESELKNYNEKIGIISLLSYTSFNLK